MTRRRGEIIFPIAEQRVDGSKYNAGGTINTSFGKLFSLSTNNSLPVKHIHHKEKGFWLSLVEDVYCALCRELVSTFFQVRYLRALQV